MAENVGMNQLLCSPEGVEEIRNAPCTAVESFGVFHGSGEVGRDYDIPTAQNLSNGVILYYTPKKDAEDETEKETHHCGLGSLDMLPVSPQVIMSHGGSRGIQAAAFVQFVSGIARNFAVLAFQKDRADSEDQTDKRVAGFNYFFSDANGTVQAMGGRSRGARCATRSSVYSANRNLILWSYPLVRDMEVRKQELLALPADARVLFIKGSKDWMGPEIVFRPVRQQMQAKTWQITVRDMDHNFNCKTELEEQKVCNALGVIAGLWLRGDAPGDSKGRCEPRDAKDGTEMRMHWDAKKKEVVWTGWNSPADLQSKQEGLERDVADLF